MQVFLLGHPVFGATRNKTSSTGEEKEGVGRTVVAGVFPPPSRKSPHLFIGRCTVCTVHKNCRLLGFPLRARTIRFELAEFNLVEADYDFVMLLNQ